MCQLLLQRQITRQPVQKASCWHDLCTHVHSLMMGPRRFSFSTSYVLLTALRGQKLIGNACTFLNLLEYV